MGATAGIGGTANGWETARRARRPVSSRALARWLTVAVAVVAVVLGAGALGLGLYASAHADRVYAGVEVAGVRVGGMAPAEARAALEERFAAYAAAPLTLTAGEQRFALTPARAGARLDGDASVAAALAYGREGSVWSRSREWARALVRGATVEPRVVVDQEVAERRLRGVAAQVVRAPTDAAVRMDAGGRPVLVADTPGVAVDLGATQAALTARLAGLESDPIPLVTRPKDAAVPAAALGPSLERATAAVAAPLTLTTDEGGLWHLPAADVARVVSVDPAAAALRIDRRSLTSLVEGLAAGIDREAVDAAIVVDEGGALVPVPSVAMANVDVATSVEAIEVALLAGRHDVQLTVARAAPKIDDAAATASAAEAERLIAGGMDLTWAGGSAQLGRDDLLRALTITPKPGEPAPFAFDLDRAVVAELLAPIAEDFDRPVVDARFRIVDGRIRAVSEAKAGRELDVEVGVQGIVAAFGKPDPAAKLRAETLEPRYTAADAGAIRLGDDLLADASTSYAYSSEPRRRNVERAAELESGWLVPPGGIFSYVENVGEVDAGNGFVTGFGIVADEGGGVTTAPVIGGGICQVSTTIFQAAFWAGLPIEERYQHPYYLRSYGEAPRGLPGLDAMVNIEEDWALDLKFRNPTDEWLAVVVIADGQSVSARIVGTDPGWEVRVSEPKVTNFAPKETGMTFTDSSELPRGQELLVESAEDGFDVSVERVVVEDGKTIDEYRVDSSFSPARNLTLRGTGG